VIVGVPSESRSYTDKTMMLFGDARAGVGELVRELATA
jgi:NAD/NADP transhydrogenase beta subunit